MLINLFSHMIFLRIYDVKEFILHPDYNNDYVEYDYAIIKLKKPIDFSSKANAACLPSFTDPSRTNGELMTISGWGIIEMNLYDDYTEATVLQTASVQGYSYVDCCNSWWPGIDACSNPEIAELGIGHDILCAGNMTHKV